MPTYNDKILIAHEIFEDFEQISKTIDDLFHTSESLSNDEIVYKMKRIVPEFKSLNSIFETLDNLSRPT